MIELPEELEAIAQQLFAEGYRHSEAYPIERWRRLEWPEDPFTYRLIDGCLKILWALEERNCETKKTTGPGK